MNSVYVITRFQTDKAEKMLCCLIENDRLMEVKIEEKSGSILGNIYIGKVKNVLKNIDAAFVEIAGGQICFLPLADAQSPVLTNRVYDGRILAGDEILVQVQKDAVKTKDPVLTAKLNFSGQYISLVLGEQSGIRYSHQLSKEAKSACKQALVQLSVPEKMTLIVRTAADELLNNEEMQNETAESALTKLVDEAQKLMEQAKQFCEVGKTRTVYSLLSKETPWYLKMIQQNKTKEKFKVITDELLVYTTLKAWKKENNSEEFELSFYQDEKLSLSGLYGLQAKMQEALAKKVWLKSGGNLVIEPTEALTVIDVNTGKFTDRKEREQTFIMINEEAAQETARQLRLRNLSGIILVDFINMSSKAEQQRLLSLLKAAVASDPVPVQIVDITKLGLVEITRKKISKTLAEQLN